MTTSHLINANRFEDTYQLVILSAQREESPRPSRVHIAWGFFPFAKLRVRMTRCTQFGPPIRVSLPIPIYEMAFKIYGCLLLLVLAQPGTCAMRAGAASAVITPKLDGKTVYLAGFGHN